MKFEIDRNALVEPLQFVSGVVERRQTLPVLANIKITVKKWCSDACGYGSGSRAQCEPEDDH